MPISLILVILELLPKLFSDLKQFQSLTGSTQNKVDAAAALLINTIPDSLAPAYIPEIKKLLQLAVSLYDEVAPIFTHAPAAAPVATVATVTVAAAAPAAIIDPALGLPMPATLG